MSKPLLSIFATLIIVVLATVLYLANQNPESQQLSQDIEQSTTETPSITPALSNELPQSAKPLLIDEIQSDKYCPDYKNFDRVVSRNKSRFLELHATRLFLEGEQVDALFSVLFNRYDSDVAYRWLNRVMNIDMTLEDNIDVLSKIATLQYTLSTEPQNNSSVYFKQSYSNVSPEQEDFAEQYIADIERRAQLNPQMEAMDWFGAFFLSVVLNNDEFGALALDKFNGSSYEYRKMVVYASFHKIREFLGILNQQQLQTMLDAIGEFLPFESDDAVFVHSLNQTYAKIAKIYKLSTSRELAVVTAPEFSMDTTVEQLFVELEQENPDLAKQPSVEELCVLADQPVSDVAIKKVNASQIGEGLWQQAYQQECRVFADETNMLFAASYLDISITDISRRETLLSASEIASYKAKIESAPDDIKPYAYLALYELANHSVKKEFVLQMEQEKLFAKDPNFSMFLAVASHKADEQRQILERHAQDLAPYGADGRTLIYNLIKSNWTNQNELIIDLINQGLPLKRDSQSPDPLLAYLQKIKARIQTSEDSDYQAEESSLQLLDMLVDRSQVDDAHINLMASLKYKNKQAFDYLYERHPDLYPHEPEFMVDFECEDSILNMH
ncbi:hypothetical protein [Thalassotalea sp. Y01]|uniref:hypothetical protein n=1 Tax=Thalassotalea sp. Y01 TaxID=2729613 RepID=UPI00145D5323|nr:hypothetical protein [Thalassotalea sp. Y01]NMP17088.1 hypothetical protein [Thalassotalea sp. Y01]